MVTNEYNVATGVRTVTEDYGDGTGLRTVYDNEGVEIERTPLTGLPIPEPQSQTFVEAINAINPDHAQLLMALILDPDRLAILLDLTQGDTP